MGSSEETCTGLQLQVLLALACRLMWADPPQREAVWALSFELRWAWLQSVLGTLCVAASGLQSAEACLSVTSRVAGGSLSLALPGCRKHPKGCCRVS